MKPIIKYAVEMYYKSFDEWNVLDDDEDVFSDELSAKTRLAQLKLEHPKTLNRLVKLTTTKEVIK